MTVLLVSALGAMPALPAAVAVAAPLAEIEPAASELVDSDGAVEIGSPASDAVADGYVVQFVDGVDAATADEVLAEVGVEAIVSFDDAFVGAHVDADAAQVAALRADERVAAIVPNTVTEIVEPEMSAGVEPTEPTEPTEGPELTASGDEARTELATFGELAVQEQAPWALDRVDQRRLPLNAGFDVHLTGAGVTAYVLDSGVMPTHAEFSGRVRPGAYINDGMGAADCRGHGTHVAGLIGGETYGVAKDVSIVPVRVLDCNGVTTVSWTVTGLNWIIAHHQAGQPAVLNMSLGGNGNAVVDAAVEAAIADGIVVVAAAGNDGGSACNQSPARVPAAITVSATDDGDWSPTWSNKGECVDVFAPGSKLVSASTASTTAVRESTGTSMAAPVVAGAVALILQASPGLSPAEVAARLVADATPDVVRNAVGSPNRLLFVPTQTYVAMSPVRLMDSRVGMSTVDGAFAGQGVRIGGAVTELQIAGRGGVPVDAAAVVLNVTATEAAGAGFVTVFPCGSAVPNGSSLNFRSGATIANAVVAKVGVDGRVCLFSNVGTHLIVDVNGFYPMGSSFESVSPARLLDSRADGQTIDGTFVAAGIREGGVVTEVQVAGRGGVPADAEAVVLNVTATEATGAGFVSVYPCGSAVPNGSNLNYWTGATIANAVVAKVGVDGRVCLFSNVATHLIVDVNGFYANGSSFVPMTPTRLSDTRPTARTVDGFAAGGGEVPGGLVIELQVGGRGGVPLDATAVVLNVTVTQAGGDGFVTVFPCGSAVPNGSNLNYWTDATIPNAVVAKLGAAGRVCIYSNRTTHLIVDVNGYQAA